MCGCNVEVFGQEGMSKSKLKALQAGGATVTQYGNDCVEAEIKARQTAKVISYRVVALKKCSNLVITVSIC